MSMSDERVISFGPYQTLPPGWVVVQLDSGHYMGTNGQQETPITVNRFHARRWSWQMASSTKERTK